MQFDQEDFVTYRGKALHRSIVQEKIGSLGWSPEQTMQLTDEQVRTVMDQRLSPDQVDIQYTEHGSHVVKSGEVDNSTPRDHPMLEITTPGLSLEETTRPPLPGSRLTNVQPPVSTTPVTPQPEDDSPIIGRRAIKPQPEPPPPPPPPASTPDSLPSPATDWRQVITLLDAVVALASIDTTFKQASALATAHNLWYALEAYDNSAYNILGGASHGEDGMPKDDACVGGTILKCEVANGAIHILTTKGTLTLTGKSINLAKQEQ